LIVEAEDEVNMPCRSLLANVREEREREELQKIRELRPKIQQQFADLKRELAKVSEEEWAAIPDIGDRSIKKQKRQERCVLHLLKPVPNSAVLTES